MRELQLTKANLEKLELALKDAQQAERARQATEKRQVQLTQEQVTTQKQLLLNQCREAFEQGLARLHQQTQEARRAGREGELFWQSSLPLQYDYDRVVRQFQECKAPA